MNDDLTMALSALMERAAGPADPERVEATRRAALQHLARARGRARRRRVAGGVGSAALIAAAAGFLVLALPRGERRTAPAGTTTAGVAPRPAPRPAPRYFDAEPQVTVPAGWSETSGGYVVPGCACVNRVVRVSNAPSIPAFAADVDGGAAAAALRPRQVLIDVTTFRPDRRLRWPAAPHPMRVRAADFRLPYEGQQTRALAVENVTIDGVPTTIRVGIDPLPRPFPARPTLPAYTPALIRRANAVLATLRVTRSPNPDVPQPPRR